VSLVTFATLRVFTHLGRVDLLFKPEEGTDKVEKAQEVSGQFVKTRKYMSVLL